MEWLPDIDWQFIIGDILVPIGIFIAGYFVIDEVGQKKINPKGLLRFLAVVILILILLFYFFRHEHTWVEATCTTPKICSECGETEGIALGHQMNAATCDSPEACAICGESSRELGHQWTEANYFQPKTCQLCGATEGSKLIPDPVYINELNSSGKYGKLWTMGTQAPDYYVHTDVNDAEDYKDMNTPGHTTGPVYDYLGNVYTYGLHIDGDEYSAYYISYDIGGIYSSFTGTYCMSPDMDGDPRASTQKYFEVYGDGKPLFTSKEISQGSPAYQFSIDITGVRTLTIQYPKTPGPSRIATIFDGMLN